MSKIELKGSCLCGSVEYQLNADTTEYAPKFFHCHCQRCRKASGTGHTSLIIIGRSSLKWTKGEDYLGHYKVPEAEHFATCFCRECGSPLPRYNTKTTRVVIPSGSLDHEPGIKPKARIFWDSRAAWSCEDDLPAFSEYPE